MSPGFTEVLTSSILKYNFKPINSTLVNVKSMHFSQMSVIQGKNALTVPMIVQSWLVLRSLFYIIDLDLRPYPGS